MTVKISVCYTDVLRPEVWSLIIIVVLVIKSPPPPAPPSIKLLLEDPLVVNPGETITLVCVASGGDPPPTLKWVRPGGEELPKRSVVKRGTLTVPAVTMDDGGTYICVASNNVGNPAKKSTSILIRGTTLKLNLNLNLVFRWRFNGLTYCMSPLEAECRGSFRSHLIRCEYSSESAYWTWMLLTPLSSPLM